MGKLSASIEANGVPATGGSGEAMVTGTVEAENEKALSKEMQMHGNHHDLPLSNENECYAHQDPHSSERNARHSMQRKANENLSLD